MAQQCGGRLVEERGRAYRRPRLPDMKRLISVVSETLSCDAMMPTTRRMKSYIVSMFSIAMIVSMASGCRATRPLQIRSAELGNEDRYRIIGALGLPICHLADVHAVVIDGDRSEYALNITSINGRLLSTPIRMRFEDRTYKVPVDSRGRYYQIHGNETGKLSKAELIELRKGYVGQEYDLLVYETGLFGSPPPEEAPDGEALFGQGEGFGFDTYVSVVKVLKEYPCHATIVLKAGYDATVTESWKKLRLMTRPYEVVVTSATEIIVNGIKCRLFGIKPPEDKNRSDLAKHILELCVASYGGYFSIYNTDEPVSDKDGVPLIWCAGHGDDRWVQELLVQEGVVDVDISGYEGYSFSTLGKNGFKPQNWKLIFSDAIAAQKHNTEETARVKPSRAVKSP